MPTDIKSVTYDETNIYVGTSNGKVVAVPIEHLRQGDDPNPELEQTLQTDSIATHGSPSNKDKVEGVCLGHSAVSLHAQRDNKIKTLLHIPLPAVGNDTQDCPGYASLPNLGGGARGSLGHPLYQSLIVSAGKGHIEYSSCSTEDPEDETAAARIRARNKSFQLLLWGHRSYPL